MDNRFSEVPAPKTFRIQYRSINLTTNFLAPLGSAYTRILEALVAYDMFQQLERKEVSVEVVSSKNGVPIRLTEERWSHIVERHLILAGTRALVVETLEDPEVIQRGDTDELLAARLYPDTPLGEKWMVVAYRETSPEDGFIITAYLARRLSRTKEELWRRS